MNPVKIEYLIKEELAHELKALHIPFNTEHTCDDLRKLLRQTRSLVRRGSLKPSPALPVDCQEEVVACKTKIQELEAAVSSSKSLTNAQRDRLVGRANYYLGRLARVTGHEAEVNGMKGSLVNCLSVLNPEAESSDSEVEIFCSPVRGASKSVCHIEPRYNLCSLNLKYKGDTCVRAFITRLEELRLSRDIPERIILNGFPDIVDGPALFWYRGNKHMFSSYSELLAALKTDFDIPDFDFKLKREITARTQARYESIVVYLSIMGGLFSRLTEPLSEMEKLNILTRNIRPEYSRELALVDVSTVQQLKTLCVKLELANSRAADFVEPSSSRYTIAPDMQFRAMNPRAPRKEEVASFDKPPMERTPYFCFRCSEAGHPTNRCPRSREVLCFKCGYKGVRSPDCPSCNEPVPNPKN